MEKNETIEQVIDNLDKNIVYKTKNSVLTGILLVVAGIASLISYSVFEWGAKDVASQFLFILGFICLITGILKIFIRKSYYVSAQNQMKIKLSEIYFHTKEHDNLIKLVETGNYSGLKQLKAAIVDGLKLRVMATKDGQICFTQAIAYVGNEYVSITPAQKLTVQEYQILTELMRSGK